MQRVQEDQSGVAPEYDRENRVKCNNYRVLKYSEYGFRHEEKFNVLPVHVKRSIENRVLNWLSVNPRTRLCLGDVLGMSLTVLAHATHQVYMDWQVFLDVRANDETLLRVIRCFKTCVPEPGTYVGEIVAQFFQHCKQQTNLNVKRKVQTSDGERPTSGARSRRSGVEKKFEMIMSLKRVPEVSIMFRTLQKTALDDEEGGRSSSSLRRYLATRVFGTLCYADRASYLTRFQHEIRVHQYNNRAGGEVYFSLDVVRNSKYDQVLDRVFESVHLYNGSLSSVPHRIGECNVVYCSDTLYFMDMTKSLFVDNSVTYIYCFLTGKHKPVIETKEEVDAFGLAKIISAVEYATKCSLKRSHNSRMGHGPLTSVISEGGLNESSKFVNNRVRNHILLAADRDRRDDGGDESDGVDSAPASPTYQPWSSPPPPPTITRPEDGVENDCTGHKYVVNEPYVNTFLNRPVECGTMY